MSATDINQDFPVTAGIRQAAAVIRLTVVAYTGVSRNLELSDYPDHNLLIPRDRICAILDCLRSNQYEYFTETVNFLYLLSCPGLFIYFIVVRNAQLIASLRPFWMYRPSAVSIPMSRFMYFFVEPKMMIVYTAEEDKE
ncbi:unnamed protein product [Dicrocoelium dendriticum]|nr:unnamed protein product [Dicrocoelium dendriticum]